MAYTDTYSIHIYSVFNEQDAQAAAHAEQQLAQDPPGYALSSHHQNMISAAGPSNAFNSNGEGLPVGGQRRPAMEPQGLQCLHGRNHAPARKSGVTFNHILSRLQGELARLALSFTLGGTMVGHPVSS